MKAGCTFTLAISSEQVLGYLFNLRRYTFDTGDWVREDASGCKSQCGMGEHGTDGSVTCSESTGCDDSEKPDAKKCAPTPACGTHI